MRQASFSIFGSDWGDWTPWLFIGRERYEGWKPISMAPLICCCWHSP